jgi:RTX calcium-binding nonapeptide repeat (4 copies)
LFSGVHLSGGVLSIAGHAGSYNTIVVSEEPDHTGINAELTYKTSTGVVINIARTFPTIKHHINLVTIVGGRVGNNIVIDQSVTPFTTPTNIKGGAGDDFILAGNERDTIHTGAGNDTVYTGNGNDKVWTGDGTATVYAGSGHDRLVGGTGDGTIYAGSGRDTLIAYHGHDTLVSGTGPDTFLVNNNKRTPIIKFNSAKDKFRHIDPPSTPGKSAWQQFVDDFFPFFG